MEQGEQLLKCFSTDNKRRLLNILNQFPMTHTDLVKVTNIKKEYVQLSLKEFVNSKLIVKDERSHKLRIYSPWWYDLEFSIKEVSPKRVIDLSNHVDSYNRELNRRGMDKVKVNISRKSQTRKRVNDNPLPDYPVNFIQKVFNLFQFNNPQFKKDIDFIKKNPHEMRGAQMIDN